MTLPVVPGSSMSFSQINTELGLTSTALISLNDAAVRTLAGVGASPATIAITNLSGKANQFSFTVSANQTNANLRTLAVAAGWGGSSNVVATINAGVYVYSTSTGTPGLTIDGSWPGGITLTNNGYIMGMGGVGATVNASGAAGGTCISLGVSCSIVNNSYIGGGGGGGGSINGNAGGGGGSGGADGGSNGGLNPGGTGGGVGGSGGAGGETDQTSGKNTYCYGSGGGGGRIMPGVGGSRGSPTPGSAAGGGGGSGGGGGASNIAAGFGGAGGSAGSVGNNATGYCGGGGGGWGASGGSGGTGGRAGGAGGKAIALNGFTATRSGAGATYGTVS